jgi:hypothetical protein
MTYGGAGKEKIDEEKTKSTPSTKQTMPINNESAGYDSTCDVLEMEES